MKRTILAILFALFLTGCGDDKKSEGPKRQPSNPDTQETNSFRSAQQAQNFLSNKQVQLISGKIGDDNLNFDNCSLDNIISLFGNGTYTYIENTPCDSSDRDSSGTWKIENQSGKIVLIINDTLVGESTLETISYSNSSVKFKMEYMTDSGTITGEVIYSVRPL